MSVSFVHILTQRIFFFMLMVIPKSFQAWENLLMRHWSCCSVYVMTAASLAKSGSLIVISYFVCTKKMLMRMILPCLTPFLMSKGLNMMSLYWMYSFGETYNFQENAEQPIYTDQVKCLGEVNEAGVVLFLFLAFLL